EQRDRDMGPRYNFKNLPGRVLRVKPRRQRCGAGVLPARHSWRHEGLVERPSYEQLYRFGNGWPLADYAGCRNLPLQCKTSCPLWVKSGHFAIFETMFALPKADIAASDWNVAVRKDSSITQGRRAGVVATR